MIACCSTWTAPFFAATSPLRAPSIRWTARSTRTLFVTNNASRSAEEVAEHLRELGFTATADDVVTSAQSAAGLLAQQLPAGAKVLVVGTDALAAEVTTVGLTPVRLFADEPVAVVQGHSTDHRLARSSPRRRWPSEPAHCGWRPTSTATLPTERGLLPGNGAMVAALRAATDAEPQVAGKPAPTLMRDALARGTFHRPLVVGDRLDTDIEGANAAELPSLMVLTGVNNAARRGVRLPRAAAHLSSAPTCADLHDDADTLGGRRAPGLARRGRRLTR